MDPENPKASVKSKKSFKKPVDEKWHVAHESLGDPNQVPWRSLFSIFELSLIFMRYFRSYNIWKGYENYQRCREIDSSVCYSFPFYFDIFTFVPSI